MVVWAIADRALDLIGLGTVIYFTVKVTLLVSRWLQGRKSQQKRHPPRAYNLNRD